MNFYIFKLVELLVIICIFSINTSVIAKGAIPSNFDEGLHITQPENQTITVMQSPSFDCLLIYNKEENCLNSSNCLLKIVWSLPDTLMNELSEENRRVIYSQVVVLDSDNFEGVRNYLNTSKVGEFHSEIYKCCAYNCCVKEA